MLNNNHQNVKFAYESFFLLFVVVEEMLHTLLDQLSYYAYSMQI